MLARARGKIIRAEFDGHCRSWRLPAVGAISAIDGNPGDILGPKSACRRGGQFPISENLGKVFLYTSPSTAFFFFRRGALGFQVDQVQLGVESSFVSERRR